MMEYVADEFARIARFLDGLQVLADEHRVLIMTDGETGKSRLVLLDDDDVPGFIETDLVAGFTEGVGYSVVTE